MRKMIITGEWDGEVISRPQTAAEALAEELEIRKHAKPNYY